uniref:ABC transporter A family member 1 n=1 Tax=Lygus hesperus TaxID=30085 RepID=A0A0A9YQA3_LYGHE
MIYILTMLLIILIFVIFQRKEFISADRIGATMVLFLVYGFASIATAYILHFLFKEHSSAQNCVMVVSFVTGFLFLIIVFTFSVLNATQNAGKTLKFFFRIVPSYAIGEGIVSILMAKFTIAGTLNP